MKQNNCALLQTPAKKLESVIKNNIMASTTNSRVHKSTHKTPVPSLDLHRVA